MSKELIAITFTSDEDDAICKIGPACDGEHSVFVSSYSVIGWNQKDPCFSGGCDWAINDAGLEYALDGYGEYFHSLLGDNFDGIKRIVFIAEFSSSYNYHYDEADYHIEVVGVLDENLQVIDL